MQAAIEAWWSADTIDMRIAYWDCFSGIAGDMSLGAMVGCGLEVDDLIEDLSGLKLDGYRIEHRRVQRGALAADKIDVVIDGSAGNDHDQPDHPPQRGLADIREILAASHLPEGVSAKAERVFEALCEAEAAVHGCALDAVHLHEVGAIDAIVDIVGACCGLKRLGIEAIRCSPLNVGSGQVMTAHGLLPVPAPATVHLLRDAPVYSRGTDLERVTPTGAALVAVLAEGFGPWPTMTVRSVGYGAGDHDFDDRPNVLRMVVGDLAGDDTAVDDDGRAGSGPCDGVSVIETNLDDANPQLLGALMPKLVAAGARDAFATPVFMKKNRPGVQLTAIAADADVDAVIELVLRESTTLGVRIHRVERRELDRRHLTVDTPWGAVRVKVGSLHGEPVNWTPEFDDCQEVAERASVAVKRVIQAAHAAYERVADDTEEPTEESTEEPVEESTEDLTADARESAD